MTPLVREPQHNAYQKTLLCHIVLQTRLIKDRVSIKVSLDNYEGFIDLQENI